jgi:hypothetical protein
MIGVWLIRTVFVNPFFYQQFWGTCILLNIMRLLETWNCYHSNFSNYFLAQI